MIRTTRATLLFFFLIGCNAPTKISSEETPTETSTGITEIQGIFTWLDDGDRKDYGLHSERRWIRLRLDSDPEIAQNTPVRVVGYLDEKSDTMRVTGIRNADPQANIAVKQSALVDSSAGRVAVIHVVDTNLSPDKIFTEQALSDALFGVPDPLDPNGGLIPGDRSSNAYFKEVSYGKFELSGKVFMGFALDLDVATCNSYTLFNWLETGIRFHEENSDLSLEDYDQFIAVIQRDGGTKKCSSAGGQAMQFSSDPGKIWVNSHGSGIMAHELGHNLGVNHANAYRCVSARGLVPISEDCVSEEYGDANDTMGKSVGLHHFNGYNKMVLGWLDENNVTEVTADGEYTLVPLEIDAPNQTQSLLIPLPEEDGYYQLELRAAVGFDEVNSLDDVVLLRKIPFVYPTPHKTQLISPAAPYSASNDGLQEGVPFSDPTTGISITLLGIDSADPAALQTAHVLISTNAPTCYDELPNGSETGVDCGGLCDPCADGAGCSTSIDCDSVNCIDGVCEPGEGGLTQKFALNIDTWGPSYVRQDPVVDFAWGNLLPNGDTSSGLYTVEWIGSIVPDHTDSYTFFVNASNRVVLTIGGNTLIDETSDVTTEYDSTPILLETGKAYPIELRYFDGTASAETQLLWASDTRPEKEVVPRSRLQPAQSGLVGEYFDNRDPELGEVMFTRLDNMLATEWKGRTPFDEPWIFFGHFSVRWTGQLIPRYSEEYTIHVSTLSDDAKVWIDGQLVVDLVNTDREIGKIQLTQNVPVDIKVELYNNYSLSDTSGLKLSWFSASQSIERIPDTQLLPTVLGDVNSDGVVNIVDALMTAQYYVGLYPVAFNPHAADVDCSGTVDILDALLLAQDYVGMIDGFTCN